MRKSRLPLAYLLTYRARCILRAANALTRLVICADMPEPRCSKVEPHRGLFGLSCQIIHYREKESKIKINISTFENWGKGQKRTALLAI